MKKNWLCILLSLLALVILSACVPGDPVDPVDQGDSVLGEDCTTLPPVSDYSKPGPFKDAAMFKNVGPGNNYTLFRPDASLGDNGFIHPIVTWGNGIMTNPTAYNDTLTLFATHGFVIIACNDIRAERACLSDGLDWLIQENASGGEMRGKLDTSRELTVGYSWGGGAAIDTADRPNVVATISMHGMPPRNANAHANMHSPLLLFTSTGDSFVTASGYVTPVYNKAQVQTFYATLQDNSLGHLYILDSGGGAAKELGPAIAWMRYWACDDRGARDMFFGTNCEMCVSNDWNIQRKNWMD